MAAELQDLIPADAARDYMICKYLFRVWMYHVLVVLDTHDTENPNSVRLDNNQCCYLLLFLSTFPNIEDNIIFSQFCISSPLDT